MSGKSKKEKKMSVLTVKQIEKGGRENITTADVVEFVPRSDKNGEAMSHQVIAYGVPAPVSDGCIRYGSGTIYIMNASGSTIARYDLD